MEMDEEPEEDPFLSFIEYARSIIAPEDENEVDGHNGDGAGTSGPGWSWIASRILKTCIAYSSGVTAGILLSDLSQAWNDHKRTRAPKKRLEYLNLLRRNNGRRKLPKTVTIDSIYEKNFLSLGSVLEAVIVDAYVLPGTNIYMLTLGDVWSFNTIDLYLHRRYYELVDLQNGILKKGREILLTGCHLRTAKEGFGSPRLLPTEYLVILLDEDQDDDAILIAAQFCSDSFSSISLDTFKNGTSYSLYARIESIGSLETHGKLGRLQRQQITLVDGDGLRLQLFLWGEQVNLASLFSVGSMLGLDKPYIASSVECNEETNDELFLECGSATQLYLVPSVQHEEQVCVSLTQNRYHGSRLLSSSDPSQNYKTSQMMLPCNSEGSIDFSNYPFRSFIIDLREKMTGISLYGVVRDVFSERDMVGIIFSLKIEDATGAIWARLHFPNSWSLGKLGIGHVIYISGLSCTKTRENSLELLWYEKDDKASFINISCLPALLNSLCLHKPSSLSDLSRQSSPVKICRVRLVENDHWHVTTRFSHISCGHFVEEKIGGDLECSFCQCNCSAEAVRSFHLKMILADETSELFAWCSGQTASALLQISADEFYELPEDDQFMYHSSLESETFVVALVNCNKKQDHGSNKCLSLETDGVSWEITRALKCQ